MLILELSLNLFLSAQKNISKTYRPSMKFPIVSPSATYQHLCLFHVLEILNCFILNFQSLSYHVQFCNYWKLFGSICNNRYTRYFQLFFYTKEAILLRFFLEYYFPAIVIGITLLVCFSKTFHIFEFGCF